MGERELPIYKIMLLGDGGVGKSALTLQLVHNYFESNYDPTVEDTYQKETVIDGEPCRLDILDTAGQEEFLAMRESNMRDHHGFILVFAVDNPRSLVGLEQISSQVARVHDGDAYSIVVAANKCDLKTQVDLNAAEEKFKKAETSALKNEGVDKTFSNLVRLMKKQASKTTEHKKCGKCCALS